MVKQKVLDYTVILKPDVRSGTGEKSYLAYCPTLQVFSEGETVEKALINIKEAIELNLQIMAEDRQDIPVERTAQTIVASTRVFVPTRATLAIA